MSILPAISIVTPSFNQGAFIREAVLSVWQQGYPNCEQLIMDGGSNDGTVAVLRELSHEDKITNLSWVSEPDRGQAHALNKGFARANGDVIGWLNSDDRYRPGAFHSIAALFAQHPDVDVFYGDYAWMDADGRIQRVRREIEFSPFILLYHRVLYIPTTATFFRRRILDEGNLLDESLHYAMDFEFFVRLSRRGYSFMHMRQLLADFRLHEASKTCSTPGKQLQEHDQVMRRYSPVSEHVKGDLPRGLIFGLLRLAAGALRYSEKLVRGCYFAQPRSLTSDL